MEKLIQMNILLSINECHQLAGAIQGLPNDATIVEFGSGGSTIYFACEALHHNQQLISVEHTDTWYDVVSNELKKLPIELQERVVQLYQPIPSGENKVYAQESEETPTNGTNYLWPDIDWSTVRMVFVDGIMRASVLALTRQRCRPDTRIFLHDYAGREHWYDWAVQLYQKVAVTDMLLEMSFPASAK